MFQTNIEGQSVITYPIFTVPIRNAKETGEIEYDLQAPIVAYHQNASNNCYFISLAYVFTASGEINAASKIALIIEESLYCLYQGYKDMITFANDVISDQVRNPGEQRLHCNIKKY